MRFGARFSEAVHGSRNRDPAKLPFLIPSSVYGIPPPEAVYSDCERLLYRNLLRGAERGPNDLLATSTSFCDGLFRALLGANGRLRPEGYRPAAKRTRGQNAGRCCEGYRACQTGNPGSRTRTQPCGGGGSER